MAVVAEAKALTEPAGLEIPHPQALRKDQMAVFLLLLLVELAAVAEVQAQQEVRLALVELAAVAQERRLVFLVVPSHTLVVGVVAVILEISLLLVAQAALGEVETVAAAGMLAHLALLTRVVAAVVEADFLV